MNIIFDLDDTLYERSDSFERAYDTFFEEKIAAETTPGSPCAVPADRLASIKKLAFRTTTDRCNEKFLASQRGEIPKEEMQIYRWEQGLKDVGFDITRDEAKHFQDLYAGYQKKIRLAAGAAELLDYCKEHFSAVGILTNGPADHQMNKVKILGLAQWIDPARITISGAHGIDKPDLRIFEIARQTLGNDETILYVGDNMKSDIVPAKQLGWTAVYVHKYGAPDPSGDILPDYEIEAVGELLDLLKKSENSMHIF